VPSFLGFGGHVGGLGFDLVRGYGGDLGFGGGCCFPCQGSSCCLRG
jgi:hypothetical protein